MKVDPLTLNIPNLLKKTCFAILRVEIKVEILTL